MDWWVRPAVARRQFSPASWECFALTVAQLKFLD